MDKQYLKRAALYVFAVLFSLFMAFYIGYHIHHALTATIVTEPAREVTRSSVVRADAYIFRNEEVLDCTTSGTCLADFADGTHVSAGSAVASVYSADDSSAQATIRSLTEQLSLLEGYSVTSRGAKDAAAIDARIYGVMEKMKLLREKNDFAGILGMRSELLCEMNQRAVVSGSGDGDFSALIASVEAQIASERSKLGSVLSTVIAPRTGWYYSSVDGYEGIFSAELIPQLTVADFDKLTASPARNVGANAGKLVTDYRWYAVMKLNAADVATLTEGSVCDVAFAYNGGDTVTMDVERIVTETDSEAALLILSSGELRDGFSFARVQSVDVTAEALTGFSVPRSAVRMVDGTLGVYVFDGVYASFRRIENVREFDDACIAKTDTAVYAEAANAGKELKLWNERAYQQSRAEPKTDEERAAVEAAKAVNEGLDPIKDAPYLSQNDLIITEGRGVYHGKIYS